MSKTKPNTMSLEWWSKVATELNNDALLNCCEAWEKDRKQLEAQIESLKAIINKMEEEDKVHWYDN